MRAKTIQYCNLKIIPIDGKKRWKPMGLKSPAVKGPPVWNRRLHRTPVILSAAKNDREKRAFLVLVVARDKRTPPGAAPQAVKKVAPCQTLDRGIV